MSTTRTLTSPTPGPVHLSLALPAGELEVLADPDRTHAEVIITTADDTGPSAEAVTAAELDQTGDRIRAHVHGEDSSSTSVHVSSSFIGGSNVQISGGGSIVVNGQRITGGVRVSPIRVTARVPSGSSIQSNTMSARLTATGDRYDTIAAQSMSGDVDVTRARHLTANTMSGDVEAEQLETGDVSSMSGSVRVSGHVGRLSASTMSGSIRAHADNLHGRSMSGRVVNTKAS